jgi:hypothetical protein
MTIDLSAADRSRLEAIVADRVSPQKHVWRSRIVLLSATGITTTEIMRQAGVAKTCVWRWQERFTQEGVDGLLRDKTRPSRISPLGADIVTAIVARTLEEPPGEVTHRTAAAMAKRSASASLRCSVSGASVVFSRIGSDSSSCPIKHFAEKLRDVVGLYVDPLLELGGADTLDPYLLVAARQVYGLRGSSQKPDLPDPVNRNSLSSLSDRYEQRMSVSANACPGFEPAAQRCRPTTRRSTCGRSS